MPDFAPPMRLARPDDASALGALHVAAWRAAYRGLFPDEVLDRQSVERRAEQHRAWLSAPPTPDHRTWTAWSPPGPAAARLLGFSISGPARDPDLAADAGVGEVYALYLQPDCVGRGLGRALFGRSLATLRDQGRREVVLWVADGNLRAQRFYEAAGLRRDLTALPKPVVVGGSDLGVAEVRYRGPAS